MAYKVGIIGLGWVGRAMYKLFPDALIYSHKLTLQGEAISMQRWKKEKDNYQVAINKCDIVFICVPTPCRKRGRLDVSAVEESIKWCTAPLLVIRSTVNPGDCDFFEMKYGKHLCFQPEYLGESPNHPLLDTIKTPFLIIGGKLKDREKLISLYATVYNANTKLRGLTNYGAEIVKLSENRAISWRVAEFQELWDVCQSAHVDYYTIRDAVYSDDPRFNLWWSFIYPEKRGFNSKCIPKDVYAWVAYAETMGYDPKITKAILKKNREWLKLNESHKV